MELKAAKVEIEFNPDYDDYGGAFIVRCGEEAEEIMTLNDAFRHAQNMLGVAMSGNRYPRLDDYRPGKTENNSLRVVNSNP